MVVDPFWFGVGVGLFGTVLFEVIIIVLVGLSGNKNTKKGNEQ